MSIKNVYNEITSFENIIKADRDCASYDSDNDEVLEFRKNLEENALGLRNRLRRLDIPPEGDLYGLPNKSHSEVNV